MGRKRRNKKWTGRKRRRELGKIYRHGNCPVLVATTGHSMVLFELSKWAFE